MPSMAYAVEFNPHLIITDADLTAYDSMTPSDVQQFLVAQHSGLANLKFSDTDGKIRTAAEIIVAAAADEKINPRYLLVMLQKEQSIISASNPSQRQLDWATGYGVCDSCSLEDTAIQKFKGFATQVRDSAGIMRYYYDNIALGWIKRQGQSYQIDTFTVSPQSNATGFLYTYTPHITGNKNFWRLWTAWFTKSYPDGSLIQATGDKIVYLLQNGKKRQFTSKSALISRFNPDAILKVQPTDLSAYQDGIKISLPNYSLARVPDGTTFLVIDDTKHPIASAAVFKSLGYNPDEIVDVTNEDLDPYEASTFITSASIYPFGTVAQEKKTKNLYYIQNGSRAVIPSMDIVRANFPKKKILTLDTKQLAKYPLTNKSVTFKDGTLLAIKHTSFIYVVSNGKRRLIPNEVVFKNLGYSTKNVTYTDEQTFISVPEGEPISSDISVEPRLARL